MLLAGFGAALLALIVLRFVFLTIRAAISFICGQGWHYY